MSELRGVIVICTGWLLPQLCSPFTYFSSMATRNRDQTLNWLKFIPVFSVSSHPPSHLLWRLNRPKCGGWGSRKCLNSPPVGAYPSQYSLDESIHYDCLSSHSSVQRGAAAAWRGWTLRASFTPFYNYCKAQCGSHWPNWALFWPFFSQLVLNIVMIEKGKSLYIF